MIAVVVYESMYGNTRAIAEAVATGMGPAGVVIVREVSGAPLEIAADVDLLVIGAPTHAHGLSRPQSRDSAAKQGPLVSRGIGVREWLASLPATGRRPKVATFDTRFGKPRWLTGSAAQTIRKLLLRRGWPGPIDSASFIVEHALGPLRGGELERAQEWGATLAASHPAPAGSAKRQW